MAWREQGAGSSAWKQGQRQECSKDKCLLLQAASCQLSGRPEEVTDYSRSRLGEVRPVNSRWKTGEGRARKLESGERSVFAATG